MEGIKGAPIFTLDPQAGLLSLNLPIRKRLETSLFHYNNTIMRSATVISILISALALGAPAAPVGETSNLVARAFVVTYAGLKTVEATACAQQYECPNGVLTKNKKIKLGHGECEDKCYCRGNNSSQIKREASQDAANDA